MSSFRKLYVWAMNVKLFMALYFVALAVLMGLLVAVTGGDSLKLLTLAEMLLLSILIAVLQNVWLPDSIDYSKGVLFGRSVLWLCVSTALTLISSLLFGWFAGFPAWCPYALSALMVAGLFAILQGLKYEQEADTVHLNDDLRKFKEKK